MNVRAISMWETSNDTIQTYDTAVISVLWPGYSLMTYTQICPKKPKSVIIITAETLLGPYRNRLYFSLHFPSGKFFFLGYSEAPCELWDSVAWRCVLPSHTMNVVHHPGTVWLLLNAYCVFGHATGYGVFRRSLCPWLELLMCVLVIEATWTWKNLP